MKYLPSLSEKFKNAMQLVSSAIFAKDFNLLLKTPNIFLTLIAIPIGVVLNFYIRIKTK